MPRDHRLRFIFVFFVIVSFRAYGQWNYLSELSGNFPGVYEDLAGNGYPVAASFDGDPMTYDDDNSAVQDIGFIFRFNGIDFTQFVLNSNGFIKLGNREPSSRSIYYLTAQASITTPGSCITAPDSNLVYAMNHDLGPATSGGAPEYRVYVSGPPGSRVCTIQFKNLADKSGGVLVQFSNINFQIKLYEGTNEINFVYGSWTSSVNPTNFISNAVGIKGNDAARSVNVSKSSVDVWWLTNFSDGNYQYIPFNVRNSVMGFSLGRTIKFNSKKQNDARIYSVNTYGKIALPFAVPSPVSVSVINYGNNELVGIPVRLSVTGVNPFSPPVQQVSILPGDTAVLTFPLSHPVQLGADTITVTVPPDDDNMNNTETFIRYTDSSEFCHAYSQGDSGVNSFNYLHAYEGIIQQIAAKYVVAQPALLEGVDAFFLNANDTYRACVWEKSDSGRPGRLLYMSADLNSVIGRNKHTFSIPLPVTDTFFVGVRKPYTSGSLLLRYETEAPLRPNVFFTSVLSFADTSWGTFRSGAGGPKYDIGVRVKTSTEGLKVVCPGSSTFFTAGISGNSYQWQVDTGSGFTDLLPGQGYSGIQSATLRLDNLTTGMYGYRYRCKVNNNLYSRVSTLQFRVYWTGNNSSQWEDSQNWTCNFVPDENTDIVISGGASVVINSMARCRRMDISPTANLTIHQGYSLEVRQ